MMERIEGMGYSVFPGLLSPEGLVAARAAAHKVQAHAGAAKAGVRDALGKHDMFRAIAESPAVSSLAQSTLGPAAFVTRAILFDKTPEANWDVAWHQDVTIAVRANADVDGFGPWSVKHGVPHVQPPARVLERMVTVRIHLDDCGTDNWPLLVVPGSHRRGVIDIRSIDTTACDRDAAACVAAAGDAVIMRPLILHASRKSASPIHRRVLHLEFAADVLPRPLEWTRA